ncbi:MAG: LysR family transcriptional regulator [Rhizobiales bacterium]|nr:LysR family transcriptional regulator [Hyphomicrobiales bacterium]
MNGVTLKHLRYFEALASHGHFGRAAAACSISQPALSVQIKELEALLGMALVERGKKRIGLTAFGVDVAARARRIVQSVDELGDLARASAGAFAGELRLGLIPTIAPYLFPAIFERVAARFPGLDLRPREAVTGKLIDELRAGALDAAIVALPVSEPTLTELALFEEEFVLIRPICDAGALAPAPEQLADMRLLLLEEGHCFRAQALAFCNRTARPPRDLIEGGSLSTLVQMVGAGIGVTLIPDMALTLEMRSATLDAARLPAPRPTRTVGMIWRATNPLAAQFVEVARLVREAGEEARQAALALARR